MEKRVMCIQSGGPADHDDHLAALVQSTSVLSDTGWRPGASMSHVVLLPPRRIVEVAGLDAQDTSLCMQAATW